MYARTIRLLLPLVIVTCLLLGGCQASEWADPEAGPSMEGPAPTVQDVTTTAPHQEPEAPITAAGETAPEEVLEPGEEESHRNDNQDAAREARQHMQGYFDAQSGKAAGWPDCYGGCYIASGSGLLTVCLTDLSPENIALFEEACQTTDLTFQEVAWSYAELLETYELTIQLFGADIPDHAAFYCGVSASDNCVHATVAREMAQQAEAFTREHPCFVYTLADAGNTEMD